MRPCSTLLMTAFLVTLAGCGGGGGGDDEVEGDLLAFRRIAMREGAGGVHDLAFVDLLPNSSPGPFGTIPLEENDDGRVLRSTSGLRFLDLVEALTDGQPDGLSFELAVGNPLGSICAIGEPEAQFFGLPIGQVDFIDYTITGIEIEIERLDFIVPGANPGTTDVDFVVEIRVFGTANPT